MNEDLLFNLQLFSETIKLTKKDDLYTNEQDEVGILALGGNDSITNYGANVTINGGTGRDTIDLGGSDNVVSGDAGNDVITDKSEYSLQLTAAPVMILSKSAIMILIIFTMKMMTKISAMRKEKLLS